MTQLNRNLTADLSTVVRAKSELDKKFEKGEDRVYELQETLETKDNTIQQLQQAAISESTYKAELLINL